MTSTASQTPGGLGDKGMASLLDDTDKNFGFWSPFAFTMHKISSVDSQENC